jgi:hypothetical protein
MATSNSATADRVDVPATQAKPKVKRSAPLNQADVPAYTLKDALRIAEAIRDQFAKEPTTPLDLAVALDMPPASTNYKMLTGAAIAYGLTDGGAQAATIALTELGRRTVAPIEDGDDVIAMREAVLKPRIIRDFLQKYNGSPLPSPHIALNVIEQMNVPSAAKQRAYDMIIKNAEQLGLLIELKGKKYVRLDSSKAAVASGDRDQDVAAPIENNVISDLGSGDPSYDGVVAPELLALPTMDPTTNNRVFITHGKDRKVVEQIRKILRFGKFEAIVSVDQQTVAKPITDKVMDDMRSCSAAIVHVGAERKLLDADGNEHTEINPNVLIEIGAAMALYQRRFVLLVEHGVGLPSNLHGLCEVRYEGEQLDHDATMKLLEAFNEFR